MREKDEISMILKRMGENPEVCPERIVQAVKKHCRSCTEEEIMKALEEQKREDQNIS